MKLTDKKKQNEKPPLHEVQFDKNGKMKRNFVSAGERIHNEITYRGVDWILNATLGVTVAVLTARTKWGRENIQRHLDTFFSKVLAPVFVKDPTKLAKLKGTLKTINGKGANPADAVSFLQGYTNEGMQVAESLASFSKDLASSVAWGSRLVTIMFGGFTLIPPMLVLEDHKNKRGMVKYFDKMVYGKEKVENDPRFAQAYYEIMHEPKKGFWVGLLTRCMALTPIFAVALTPPVNRYVGYGVFTKLPQDGLKMTEAEKATNTGIYNGIGKMTGWAGEKMGLKKGYLNQVSAYGNEGKPITNWEFLHDTIGFDFGLTFFYSLMHEASFKFVSLFADKNKGKHKATTEKAPQVAAPDIAVKAPAEAPVEQLSQTPATETSGKEKPSTEVREISREQHLKNVEAVEQLGQQGARV